MHDIIFCGLDCGLEKQSPRPLPFVSALNSQGGSSLSYHRSDIFKTASGSRAPCTSIFAAAACAGVPSFWSAIFFSRSTTA